MDNLKQKDFDSDLTSQLGKELSKAILDNVIDGILTINEKGIILSFNSAAEKIFGYEPDEVIGQNVKMLMPDTYAPHHDGYLKRYIDTGEARVIGIGRRAEGLRKDGSAFPLDLAVSQMDIETCCMFTGIIRDMSIYEKLEKERDLFFALSLDMLCITDSKGYFVQLNPAWEAMTGYTQAELKEQPYFDLVHQDDRDQTIEAARMVSEGTDLVGFENRFLCKDGSYRWLQWNAKSYPEADYIYASAHDITEMRRITEELKIAKNIAESSAEAESQFLANMSHELRTPLNSVIGFTNVMLKDRPEDSDDQETTFLERIRDNSLHLLDLINDILDLSKIEAGKVELMIEELDLYELIDELIAGMGNQAGARHLILQSDVRKDLVPIKADRGKLKQILINLVGNAIKFTDEGHVIVRVLTGSDGISPRRIEVEDTGIGIPSDRIAVIFESFQQADYSTSRQFGGTGLGLTISRSLCELMGFELGLESEVGKGTNFYIDIPEENRIAG